MWSLFTLNPKPLWMAHRVLKYHIVAGFEPHRAWNAQFRSQQQSDSLAKLHEELTRAIWGIYRDA